MEPEQILIVDDEESIRSVLSQFLADAGCKPRMAGTAEEALSLLTKESYAAAIVDIVLPGMDGLQLLQEIKRSSPDTEVVIMTSYASLGTAVEAIRNGAYDYLQKPFEDLDDVWATVRRALEKRALIRDLENSNRELLISVRRQKCLIGAGRAMSAITSLCEILDFFIGLVADELDVDRASILLLNEKTGEMKIAASRGLAEEVVQSARVKIGEGIAGWVAREGKPILVTDVETDPRIKVPISNTNFASFISAPIVLSVPIQLEEKVLGVINVTNRRSGVPFEEEDMAFLYSLAGQAAVSIESSRNYEELQEAYQSLKTTQKQLVEAERLNAVGQMAAGVAHDFNNLLSGILGSTQLLNVELNSPDVDISSLRSALELIENLSLQGAATVRRIQEYSRIRKDVPSETVDLNAVVKNADQVERRVRIPGGAHRHSARTGDDSRNLGECFRVGPGGQQPDLQCGGSDAGRGRIALEDLRRRGGNPAGSVRYGDRNERGGKGKNLRAVLHHQGRRPGARNERCLRNRRSPQGRDQGGKRGRARIHVPNILAGLRGT
jgi:CheY-like chemotaxis protein